MRFLLLAPYLLPYNNPRALRWSLLLDEWRQQGITVDVISGKHPSRTGDSSSSAGMIYRPAYPGPAARKRVTSKNRKLLRTLYRVLIRSWMWPDDSRLWLQAARELGKKLPLDTYDAIISVSLPFGPQLLALEWKKQHPTLFWLADIGDPFSLQQKHPQNNERLFGKRNTEAERSLLELADAVVVTNEGCRQLYLQQGWHISPDKIHVIPPVGSLSVGTAKPAHPGHMIRVGHFGRFFHNIREPEAILHPLRYIQPIEHFEWHFFGDTSGLLAAADPDGMNIKQHPLIPIEQLTDELIGMDALLLPGNKTDFQVPSKIADYIRSGLPILYLGQLPEEVDPVRRLLQKHPLCIMAGPDTTADEWVQIGQQLKTWKGKRAEGRDWEQLCERHSVRQAAGAYLKLLNKES